jgi:hypothetical protein
MTMASGWFGITERDIKDATALAFNVEADTFKVPLVTDTYTPDFNAHDFYNDITNELTTAGGYTQPGNAIASPTYVVSSGFVVLDATDTAYTALTKTGIRGLVLFDDTLASDPLILAQTFGADYAPTAATLTIQHDANGIGRVDIIP